MIDSEARVKALNILNQLAENRITNWVLEETWPTSDIDPALNCIFRWLWTLYDDDAEVVIADLFGENEEEILSRCKIFLSSNQEFVLKNISDEEKQIEIKKWGGEWNPCCTEPEYNSWPFPPNYFEIESKS